MMMLIWLGAWERGGKYLSLSFLQFFCHFNLVII